MPPAVKKLLEKAKAVNGGLSGHARVVIGVSAAAVILALAFLLLGDSTRYVPLFTGLSTEDAASIVQQLRKEKVPLHLEAGGSAVMVPEQMVHETRLSLASQGLPRGGGVGFEIFDNQKFGISDFAQQVNYRRALQGELERTISDLDAVRSARVHIALPKSKLFIRDKQQVSASVSLRMEPARTLPSASVRAVVHLVSSSVAGLGPDQVTVVDTSGSMLWSGRSGIAGGGGPLEQQQRIEDVLEKRVTEMLGAALGPGHAVVKVTADVALSTTEQMETEFDPDRTVVRSETNLEESNQRQGAGAPGGIPGVRGNLPGGPAPQGGGSSMGRERKKTTRNYEVNKTVRKRILPAGELQRLSVAVLVDANAVAGGVGAGKEAQQEKVAAGAGIDLAALEDVVKKAVGFSVQRGDVVTLKSVPFANEMAAAAAVGPWSVTVKTLAKNGVWIVGGAALALVLIVLAVLTVRRKRKQVAEEVEVLSLPKTVRELESEPGGKGATLSLGTGDPNARDLAAAAARHDAIRSAAVLRTWISEG